MAGPWAKVDKAEQVNLEVIMSEEVARYRQAKGENKIFSDTSSPENDDTVEVSVPDVPEEVLNVISDDGTYNSEAIIPQMLQIQYDEELKRQCNRTAEGLIFLENIGAPPNEVSDVESDAEEDQITDDILDPEDWDRFDPTCQAIAAMPSRDRTQNGKRATKGVPVMDGIKKACKVHLFPPKFLTGESELEMKHARSNDYVVKEQYEQLDNDKMLYNTTMELCLAEHTHRILYKMFNKRLLKDISGIICMGKEAVILHAETDSAFPEATAEFSKECAIKVFKRTLSDSAFPEATAEYISEYLKERLKEFAIKGFKRTLSNANDLKENIKGDQRFMYRYGKALSDNKVVQLWAEKEMLNLERLRNADIPCPTVLALKHHVLVMSFIGKDNKPAPKLKDIGNSFKDLVIAYDQVVNRMKTMYEEAHLVHADLSEYNILWYDQQCYFIDVSQAVESHHDDAFNLLFKDCTNILTFFKEKGIPYVITPQELFQYITHFEFGDKFTLVEAQQSMKMKARLPVCC